MSRLTSAQVISLGEYLEPDFNPSTLTVSQLLGVLGYHNVPYPTPYSKPKLVKVFNDEIKARSSKFKKERLKKTNSQPSDDGITDGVTGVPLNGGRKQPQPESSTPARRSSRRLSQAPIEIEDDSPPPVVKKRRASAQPSTGTTSRRRAAVVPVPTLTEESEEEEQALPPRKVGRTKKTVAPTKARRISEIGEDSGWEDNNIFQSGAESSSPARPSPVVRRAPRKSSGVPQLKSRKSTSAPPEIDSSPTRSPPFSAQQQSSLNSFNPALGRLPQPKFSPGPGHRLFAPPPLPPPAATAHSKPPISPFAPREQEDTSVDELNILPAYEGTRQRSLSPKEEAEEEEERLFFQSGSSRHSYTGTIYEEYREPIKYSEDEADDVNAQDHDVDEEGEEEEEEEVDDEELASAMELHERDGSNALVQQHTPHSNAATSMFFKTATLFLFALLGLGIYNYKVESASIGFCDAGTHTNRALEALQSDRTAAEVCVRENRTTLYLPSLRSPPLGGENTTSEEHDEEACPLPPLIPFPHPNTCTPCPSHATCSQFSVQCDNGYRLRSHMLLSKILPPPPASVNLTLSSTLTPGDFVWTAIFRGLDGLPGLGSVALPPRCLLDPKRKRKIGALGKAIESLLAQERGRRLCVGGVEDDGRKKTKKGKEGNKGGEVTQDNEEALKWGVEIKKLREMMMKDKNLARLKTAIDETFDEAINELVQDSEGKEGGVVLGTDKDGNLYLASKDANLTWDCVLTVKTREFWAAWRSTILGAATALLTLIFARFRLAQRQSENRRVSELVQIALDALRNQELAHHTDPVSAPQPYLSSLQLRDVVLQHEHSIPARRRVWERVEHVVEGNANVRANLEEIEGGDELRVWRWVGSTGRGVVG